MSKFPDIPRPATPDDAIDLIVHLHNCVEEFKAETKTELRGIRKTQISFARRQRESNSKLSDLADDVVEIKGHALAAQTTSAATSKRLEALNTNAWKFVLTIVAAIIVAGIGSTATLATQAVNNHNSEQVSAK